MKILKKNPRKHPEKTDYSFVEASIENTYKDDNGLCSGRFGADMVAEFKDAMPISVGQVLDFGEDGKFRVIKLKPCFPEDCALRKKGEFCSLKGKVFFAEKI